ncbi:AMP-binding protein [Naasia lichenicola]|uniref:O-succinylbenzoate--CoA ligase n=1 Tax=Naasia lichenicola TaxID=2565933 RepID=A0A4S4FNI5_9MICO|nr:AMP-binding protein [Naasia lichenicola]THG31055.1 o-succinylbenzoate--CoA ligase [Naasia lichenicola]
MRALQPLEADPTEVAIALRAALSGDGPAILPVPLGSALPGDAPAQVAKPIAAVIETSGSSGAPKRVALSTDALLASVAATDAALGGPGRWLLALPVHYVAGLQVLTRSIVAGTDPIVLAAGHFDASAFLAGIELFDAERRYTSLVPAQLSVLIDAAESDPQAADRLRSLHAILVGGQRLDAAIRERAQRLGLRVIRTYGSSETGGGCVYDGVPLGTVRVRIERADGMPGASGEILLAGPMLADGYLADPARTEGAFVVEDGRRWYRTGDVGRFDESVPGGLLSVEGRRDDVIISGGEKVSLGLVEAEVRAMPGCSSALVLAAASERWGEVPIVVLPATAPDVSLSDLRGRLTAALGRAAAPDRIVRVDAIPMLASGKPDRRALRGLAGLD